MLTVRKVQGRKHFVFYLICASVTLLLGIIDLSLPVWIKYCWWEIGLFDADNTSRIKVFSGTDSIQTMHDKACGGLKHYVERSCPSACDNLLNFKNAGYVMVVFGSIALFFNFLSIGVVILKLLKKRVKWLLSLTLYLPFVFWLMGFSIYAGTAHLGRLDKPVNKASYNFDADEYDLKVGAAIAITLIPLYLASALYCWFVIRGYLIGLK